MVSISYFHKTVLLGKAFVLLMLLLGCERDFRYDDGECDYSKCVTTKPDEARVFAQITINDSNRNVPINVYSGNFEGGALIHTDTARSKTYSIYLPVNQHYTITAAYIVGDTTILAIDGGKLSIKKRTCPTTCWTVSEPTLKLHLK